MKNYFNRDKVRHPPKYTPDAVRLRFPNPGDEAKFKYRLLNDTLFGIKRTVQGLDPSEGKPRSYIPPRPPVDTKQFQSPSAPQSNLSPQMVDPVASQAKAEQNFSHYQVQQGHEVIKNNQGPQTAADQQNITAAQDQNSPQATPSNPHWQPAGYVDPLKKQQNPMYPDPLSQNPTNPNNSMPNPMTQSGAPNPFGNFMPGPDSGIPGM